MVDGRYPIHFAADYGQAEVVEYLISKGADVNVSYNSLPMRWRLKTNTILTSLLGDI